MELLPMPIPFQRENRGMKVAFHVIQCGRWVAVKFDRVLLDNYVLIFNIYYPSSL